RNGPFFHLCGSSCECAMNVTSTPSAGFRLEGVSYTFRGHKVPTLKNLDLAINPGLFCALVGPSGSGKSTLLRLMAGIEQPMLGKLTWDGRDVWAIPPQDRRFGVVFQDCPLYPERTVEAVVRFPLDSGRTSRKGGVEESVTDALEVLGL